MKVAYFDLDKTFIEGSSGTAWLRTEFRNGSLRFWDLFLGVVWLTLYHVLGVHVGSPMRMAIKRLAGRSREALEETAEQVYLAAVKGQARSGALEALAMHKAQGDKVFLLSSSLNLIVERVAKEYGFDGAIATELVVDEEGILTGQVEEPLCFSEGKVQRAQRHLRSLGLELGDCVFYSDSLSDLPLLEQAGRATAVNPDIRLARKAAAVGIPIADWGPAQLR